MKVTNLMLMTLDGEIASHHQETNDERLQDGLSNAYDQSLVHDEIMKCDAVIIGASSIRADPKILQVKNVRGVYPTWCVYTTRGFTDSLPFWQQNEVPRILVSPTPVASFSKEVKPLVYGSKAPGAFLLEYLKAQGVDNVLLLGGGHVNQMFYQEKLVNELKLTIAPCLLAKGNTRVVNAPLDHSVRLELLSSYAKDSFLYLHYRVDR